MKKDKERAIIAGFKTWRQARQAEEALRKLNVIDLNIDRISEQPVTDRDTELNNPITGKYPGLANGVYNTTLDRDQSVLASADPSASGLSDGRGDPEIGTDIVLSVVIDEHDYDQAMSFIQQHGGKL
jgi:hypothetical protein